MLKTIYNLIPTNIKIGIVIVILSILGIFSYQVYKIKSLNEELISCKVENKYKQAIYNSELDKAKVTIAIHNKAISEFKIDKDNYEKTINEKEKELSVTRLEQQEIIDKELEIDNSCENQLKLITNILEKFNNESR